MIFRPLKILLPGAALLAACGGETPSEETPVEEGRDAQGEVVGGTISDAMIPIDRLRRNRLRCARYREAYCADSRYDCRTRGRTRRRTPNGGC